MTPLKVSKEDMGGLPAGHMIINEEALEEARMATPDLTFVPLEDRTENGLFRYIAEREKEGYTCFLVHVRDRYDINPHWSHSIEFAFIDWENPNALVWEKDWYEGQQHVEYISVCCIPEI